MTAATSTGFGEQVDVRFVPLLGGGLHVTSGPLARATGNAPPGYDRSQTAASVTVSLPLGGRLLSTGLLSGAASSGAPSDVTTEADAVVAQLGVWVLETLPLVTLQADVVESHAGIEGTCGELSANGATRLTNARLGGLLGLSGTLPVQPPPNTQIVNLAGIRIVLNEQVVSGNGETQMSVAVNAIHIYLNNVLLTGLGLLSGDIVIAHSDASITCTQAVDTADLSLTLSDEPDPVTLGDEVVYQLSVHNAGPQTADGVVLTNLLPAQSTLTGAHPSQGSCSGTASVVCAFGAIAAGADATLSFTVRPSVTGTLINTAAVIAETADPDPSNNSATATTEVDDPGIIVQRADLAVTGVTAPHQVLLGDEFDCELTITNAGPETAQDVNLVNVLPVSSDLVGVTSSNGSCQGESTVSCTLGDLPAGAQRRVTFRFRPRHTGTQTLQATVASVIEDPNPANNEAVLTTPVITGGPVPSTEPGCRVGINPAATLLVPYFAVDLGNPAGLTTLLSVTNTQPASRLVQVTLWTDWGVPTMSFNTYLTGFDVQTLNLRDVLDGNLPVSGASVSPRGPLSSPNAAFPGCASPTELPSASTVAQARAWHSGQPSPGNGTCGGSPRGDSQLAVGYVTIDVVHRCSNHTPADSAYFGGLNPVASNENALLGDFFLVDPGGHSAQGEAAVHLVAEERFRGKNTFYSRFVNASGADLRQPLGSHFGVRFAHGGAFDGGTSLLVWRDPQDSSAQALPCGSTPGWFPIPQNGVLAFDEAENSTFLPPDDGRFPTVVQRVQVGSGKLPVTSAFGWLDLDLGKPTAAGSTGRPQAWVILLMTAEDRFSLGLRAGQLDDACER